MAETEKTSIKQLIQEMAGKDVEVIQGIVQSASPLTIQIVNDEKLLIGESMTYLPKHLTNYTTTCTISKENGNVNGSTSDGSSLTDFSFTGNLVIQNALQIGEMVHLLSSQFGKQYYVLGRV